MPNDVADALHRLVAASKQAGGITFMDRNGNIIMDDDKDETEDVTENEPIPVSDDNNEETLHNNDEITIEKQEDTQDDTITGVSENNQNTTTNNNHTQEHDLEDT